MIESPEARARRRSGAQAESAATDRARKLLAAATPGPWTVRHRDIGGTPKTDEMSSGLGLEVEGPPEPMLRGQFAKAADAELVALAPATLAVAITLAEALGQHGCNIDCFLTGEADDPDPMREHPICGKPEALAEWERLFPEKAPRA